MPIADPVLMHVLNSDDNTPTPVTWRPGALASLLEGLAGSLPRRSSSVQLAATGTGATIGDNTVIAAPGSGKQLAIHSFVIQNLTETPTTMILKFGSVQNFRFLGQTQGAHLAMVFPFMRELIGGDNQPLLLNLSGANTCGWGVLYYILDL
jgi:hypothetical protein